MKKPNFFIVGAPKCGTTAMYHYLRTHPQVYLSTPKEPHFFADDFGDRLRLCTDEKTYMEKFFAAANEIHHVVGEASPSYLYSQNAIANIRRFNPDARLLVMLRSPADMAYSLHSHLLYNFAEDEKDFVKAWCLQEERRAGRRIPKTCRVPALLQYKECICLGKQLRRLYSHFPRQRVKVLSLEDLTNNPKLIYLDMLQFLDLPPDERSEFQIVNANKRHRIEWLSKAFHYVPLPIMSVVRTAKERSGLGTVSVSALVNRLNRVEFRRPPMPEYLRQEILAAVHSDIELLESLTGRDLSSWKGK